MASSGAASQKRNRDKERAADMKRRGIVRTTQRCGCCYAITGIEGPKSKYQHICYRGR